MYVLREMRGWASAEMVRRYAHLAADHLAPRAVEPCSPRATGRPHATRSRRSKRLVKTTESGRRYRLMSRFQAGNLTSACTSACSRAYCVGGRPTCRVNATLNVLAEL